MSKPRFVPIGAVATLVTILMYFSQPGRTQAKGIVHINQTSFLAIQAAGDRAANQNPAGWLPPGKGRNVTIRVCTQCHGPSNFADKRYTKDRWDSVLDDMTGKGMDISDDDFAVVEKYLTTNLAPVAQHGSAAGPSSPSKN